MTVTPLDTIGSGTPASALQADEPALDATTSAGSADSASFGFGSLLDAMQKGADGLQSADRAENSFIHGTGGLQEMMFERAKADVLVSIATAASSRVTQSLNSLTQMQL